MLNPPLRRESAKYSLLLGEETPIQFFFGEGRFLPLLTGEGSPRRFTLKGRGEVLFLLGDKLRKSKPLLCPPVLGEDTHYC
ncbi:MAG: hypothetical protein A2142_04045 [candidate division Zixibacteria bacterium RBG_16_48_11]|nr:MAG: hypothetical protein A2142_04045 [candidate division Zixibacteria bacterium RBG_16_48_11]